MMQRYPARYQDHGTDRVSVFACIAIQTITDMLLELPYYCETNEKLPLYVTFILCTVNNHSLAFGAVTATHMIWRCHWLFESKSIFFFIVWEQAYLMFSGTPNG